MEAVEKKAESGFWEFVKDIIELTIVVTSANVSKYLNDAY